jgi:hypothetical protein
VHEILKVRIVAAGQRIDGLVGIGHGVEKCVERSLGKLHEGILDREVPGSAQHGMLDDMGNAGGIGGGSAKADVEDLVVVLTGKQGDPGSGLLMAEQPGICLDIVQRPLHNDLIGFGNGKYFFEHTFSLSNWVQKHTLLYSTFIFKRKEAPAQNICRDFPYNHKIY